MRATRKTVNVTGLPGDIVRAVEALVSQFRANLSRRATTPKEEAGIGAAFVNEAQGLARRYKTPGVSVVDSFIAERREEAKREADGR